MLKRDVLPNTTKDIEFLLFGFNEAGKLEIDRYPILGWLVDYESEFRALPMVVPLTFEGYGFDNEVWCLRYMDGLSERYVFPDICTFKSYQDACEYAKHHIKVKPIAAEAAESGRVQ